MQLVRRVAYDRAAFRMGYAPSRQVTVDTLSVKGSTMRVGWNERHELYAP